MELSRQRIREQSLRRFKHIRTCVLARELCLLVRTNIAALNPKDVGDCCTFVSTLCKEADCTEPSKLCHRAAELVLSKEEQFLDLCMQSCKKCGESKRPASKRGLAGGRTIYVA